MSTYKIIVFLSMLGACAILPYLVVHNLQDPKYLRIYALVLQIVILEILITVLLEKKLGERELIEKACSVDAVEIFSIINTTNREAYKDIIPKEHFKVPILTLGELLEILDRMAFYVYKSEGKIVGVAALQVESEETGKLNWVYVLSEHQRKGIGTALITHLEQKAREKGLKKMRLRTIEEADQAVNFYKKLGYRLADKIEVAWGFNVLMEKDL